MQNAAQRAVIALALVMLSALPAQALTEPTPGNASRAPYAPSTRRPGARSAPEDPFEGVNYTAAQKAEVARIHQQTLSNRDVVVKDEKLSPEQKSAMLQGYLRLEAGAIYKILTPQQQNQVRENLRARHAAAQQKQQKAVPHNLPQPAR